jgi:hypothetical protein
MRCGVDHSPPPSTKVKEREELYLYSTSRPSWPVPGGTLLYSYVNLSSEIIYIGTYLIEEVEISGSHMKQIGVKF